MMGIYHHGMGYSGMGGNSFLCTLIMLVVLIDLVLVGMWLWKRIRREDLKLQKNNCGCGGTCSTCKPKEEKKDM